MNIAHGIVTFMGSGFSNAIKTKKDDDFSNRLSNRYTVIVLVVFSIVVSFHSYVGKPITCWAPAYFTRSQRKYVNSYCWVQNTYYLPWDEHIPRADEPHETIPYYQWVPFILLAQAVLFYLPSIFWHGLNQRSGIHVDDIVTTVKSDPTQRETTLMFIRSQMDRFLTRQKRFTGYLVILFLLSKALYIANAVGQLFILNSILATHYNIYGFEVLGNIVSDHDWTEASHVAFPRVTLCDFNIRRLGNVHHYTVQCVLPINWYVEKIYIFLWFWMVFVAAMSSMSFFMWLIRTIMHNDRLRFVCNHLPQNTNPKCKMMVQGFLDNYLCQDGVFLLRLIGYNTDTITVTEIMRSLWDKYKDPDYQDNPDDDADEDDDESDDGGQ